jgi:hypothetical protein
MAKHKGATAPVEIVDLSALKADPENARKHTPRNIGLIGDSLNETGAWRSIAIDEDNTVYAGNGVVEAAAERGIERVMIVEADGNTLVAVRRTDLTIEQKRRAALFDNRAGEFALWDKDKLQALAGGGTDLTNLWKPEELERLFKVAASQPLAPGGAPDVDGGAMEPLTDLPESQIRMVQLFLTVAQHGPFVGACERLGRAFGTTSITDTVVECINRANHAIDE